MLLSSGMSYLRLGFNHLEADKPDPVPGLAVHLPHRKEQLYKYTCIPSHLVLGLFLKLHSTRATQQTHIIATGTVNLCQQPKWKWGPPDPSPHNYKLFMRGNEQDDAGFWKTSTREMEKKRWVRLCFFLWTLTTISLTFNEADDYFLFRLLHLDGINR